MKTYIIREAHNVDIFDEISMFLHEDAQPLEEGFFVGRRVCVLLSLLLLANL